MTAHVLTGLDGRNPLALLAAVGLLRVLDDAAEVRGGARPRLSFPSPGDSTPTLESTLTFDELVTLVLEDARAQSDNLALQLAYTSEGKLVAPAAGVRDLKPLPVAARAHLQRCAVARPRVAALAAALFSDVVQDRSKGNTKPTAFHFTAGKQLFLEMVEQLRTGITNADVREALIGPWRNSSTLPSLSWDSSSVRLYALRANDPAGEKRGSVAAANWLGVQALEALPAAPRGDELMTTAVRGGWKDSTFRWSLWQPALSFAAVASLLRVDARRWTAKERTALGISEVLASDISRSDQGGYGAFSPARLELPRSGKS